MPINSQNLSILASVTMDETPGNGGPPSNVKIIDGASNGMFPDVSEAARLGDLRFRKVHLWVDSDDTATFMGVNSIIAEAPDDPAVSVFMIASANAAETQADVIGRIFKVTSGFTADKAESLSDRTYVEQFFRADGSPSALNDKCKLRLTEDAYSAADTLFEVGKTIVLVDFIDDQVLKAESRVITAASKFSVMHVEDVASYTYYINLTLDGVTRYPTWGSASRFVSASIAAGKTLYGTYLAAQDITTSRAFEFYGAVKTTGAVTAGATSIPVLTTRAGIVPEALVDHPDAAELLGFDPVQLTKNADGREPIFRQYRRAVIGKDVVISRTVANGETINFGELDLTSVKVVGATGGAITSGFTVDLDAGTLTVTNITGWAQPITATARAEDMFQLSAVTETTLSMPTSRPLRRTYPVGATVSSAIMHGDRRARVLGVLSRKLWAGNWDDTVDGEASTATADVVNFPITVTNAGAVSDRVRLVFTNSTTFSAISEQFGVLGIGSTGADFAPINPAVSKPYFTVHPGMFGAGGWSASNAVLIEIEGAHQPVWLGRCIQMSPNTTLSTSFRVALRGHVDRP